MRCFLGGVVVAELDTVRCRLVTSGSRCQFPNRAEFGLCVVFSVSCLMNYTVVLTLYIKLICSFDCNNRGVASRFTPLRKIYLFDESPINFLY